MTPTIKRIVEERAKERASRWNVSWATKEWKHDVDTYTAGAEQNAPMIYAQGVADVIDWLNSNKHKSLGVHSNYMSNGSGNEWAIEICKHFKAALEHLAKDGT
jgi:hypothetical protein